MSEKALEILKKAILLERRAQKFYENVAKQTGSSAVKDIFETMAKEEEKHMMYLGKHYKSLLDTGQYEKIEYDTSESDFSSEVMTHKIKDEITAADYEASAISAAIAMEKQAIEFYGEMAKKANDEHEKMLFGWLSSWEKGHFEILEEIDKALTESVWFDNNFWPIY